MDAMISAAARALRAGDPLGALRQVALRDDAPALALRGIAMAQLGDARRARALLRRAYRAFAPRERLARARCAAALAEVALASREARWPAAALAGAARTLEARGDLGNALHARLLGARRLLLVGRVAEAERALADLDLRGAAPAVSALAALAAFDVALRRRRGRDATAALALAKEAARHAAIPALAAEVELAGNALRLPAARLLARGEERPLTLGEVEALLASGALVVDCCRRAVSRGRALVSLARRPVLLSLARALAGPGLGEATREALLRAAFGFRSASPSLRARLRVEVGRLRRELRGLAEIRATRGGFALAPRGTDRLVALAPPVESAAGALLALLSDGAAWSASALALSLGASPRTVQRALAALEAEGRARATGRGRARRWLSPPASGFTTALLLPVPPALG